MPRQTAETAPQLWVGMMLVATAHLFYQQYNVFTFRVQIHISTLSFMVDKMKSEQ